MKICSKRTNLKNFSWPIRVYHEDVDGHGIVYYANYLKFFERARTEMLRSLDLQQDELKNRLGILFVVKSLQIDFIQPVKFNEELTVTADIASIKRASLVFDQKIIKPPKHNLVLCQAMVRIACLDVESYRPKILPAKFLEIMNNDR